MDGDAVTVRCLCGIALFGLLAQGAISLSPAAAGGLDDPLHVRARTPAAFVPPQQISLRVFRLTPNGGSTGVECAPGDSSFGCVHAAGQGTYPYATNPITISMENDYLLNVVPQEMP